MDKVHRIIEERGRLFKRLSSIPYLDPIPSQGNFILTRVLEEEVKIEQIRGAAEAYGLLLRYFHHPYLSNFLRITVGLPEHTDLLTHALKTIEFRSEGSGR